MASDVVGVVAMNGTATDRDSVWPGDRNVVLTGFMGTGKSTVGRTLATRLGYDFIDTDDLIEMRHGSVASIFERLGEAEFRDLEHGVAIELAARRRTVIATGGRMMLDERNTVALAPSSRVCCLVASTDAIVARLVADSGRHERPLLQSTGGGEALRDRVGQLLAERDDGYRRFLRITTDGRGPEAIADEIASVFAAAPLSTDTTPTIVVGTALLSVLSDVVGPIRRVVGEQGDRFAAQVDVVRSDDDDDHDGDDGDGVGGRIVIVGPTPSDDPTAATVWVPTVVPPALTDPSSVSGLPASFDTIVLDTAVLQAMAPGYTSWDQVAAAIAAATG